MNDLPVLYHKGRGGAIYQKKYSTEGSDLVTEYGQVGGVLTIARRTATVKNAGRSNETTPEVQALLEAKAAWQHDKDLKYVESIEAVHQKKIDVMKAPNETWAETKKWAVYPGDVQPKLDGNRCIAYWEGDEIRLMSRGRQFWNLPHIKEQLAKIMPKDAMFDGELYKHGVSRQTINSWTKKFYPTLTPSIEFHVYDIPMCDGEERPWGDRRQDLIDLVPVGENEWSSHPDTPNIFRVPTFEVNGEDDVLLCVQQFLEAKYEGGMYRNRKGVYEWGHRSKYLLKVKPFEDDEFEVIGFTEAEGTHAGCVIWICKCDGGTFSVVPNGSLKDRRVWFKNGQKFVGQMLTVSYQNYSDDRIPQIVKGLGFRLVKDMEPKAKKK